MDAYGYSGMGITQAIRGRTLFDLINKAIAWGAFLLDCGVRYDD